MRPALLLVACWAAPAAAENEQALSLGVGFASFSAPGEAKMNMAPPSVSPDWGTGLFASYERMIGSDFGLRAALGGNVFRGGNSDKQSETSYALMGDAGLVFRFDVLHFVPYAFAGLGAVQSTGGPIDRGTDYVVVIGGGVDWLQSRKRSYGLEIRLASFAGDVTVATIGLRGTHRWGFF
ncbi:MAG: outer membrane beta-barrel protein [Myxococcota bacterium]|nr:outer membrane beta-barrel protein [Deltaproteobacteria bacterium]MDQ3335332.1 outer membrane beta-barrel protein [Myxococcota bacterium]